MVNDKSSCSINCASDDLSRASLMLLGMNVIVFMGVLVQLDYALIACLTRSTHLVRHYRACGNVSIPSLASAFRQPDVLVENNGLVCVEQDAVFYVPAYSTG